MTTSTRCRRCGVRQQGIVVECPECGGMTEVWVTREALPMRERPTLPGCTCGKCERDPNSLITRCQGVARAMRAARP